MGDSFIIAIDFGTTYSGYAFSITERNENIEPRLKYWGEEVGLETPKTPTCILFDEQENFISFGYKAKQSYVLKKNKEERKLLFFDCFKMSLYGKKPTKDLKITAANGKSMNALKVFTEALRFLKDDALNFINITTAKKFLSSEFTWVLTVPAIWDPSAKQFMREAATKAGIVTKDTENKLVIALEPEAASLCCKKLPAEGFISVNQKENPTFADSPGTRYIVVDCGGGTIDMTVHEVLEGGGLKELHKASGNNLGGQTVDRKFKEFLREIFSDGVWDEYEREHPSEVQKMIYDFTLFKKQDADAEISCPYKLGDIAQKRKEIEQLFEGVQGVSWDEGCIVIYKQKMHYFFSESLEGITKSIKEMFTKVQAIDYILLVGGYAESRVLRRHINEEFNDDCKILCPSRPQEAILIGAVEFGRNPALVKSRKSAFTYGVCIIESFDKLIHRKEKKFTNEEGEWCNDIFMTLVTADDDVGWDEIRTEILCPLEPDQTVINFTFYQTEKKQVKYVDEVGVEEIGSFDIQSPDTTLGMKREIELKIKFGFTEITATATDKETGSNQTVKLNFITKP
ncbi:heat shock 70 kDa protein 12A-like [Cyprinodon tularosa]|uniref:heat shock 70 kDa protein 12A-like n=1 Tax=Cyprinodon tularosa TaxID=77115 RepID=UPI0018E21D0F|nr:heat shock 70 kDa protein 12A-like [Cyprinodon tularosa]